VGLSPVFLRVLCGEDFVLRLRKFCGDGAPRIVLVRREAWLRP